MSKLFKTTYDWNQRYAVSEFLERSKSANYVPVPQHVLLGLFLAKEIPGVLNPQLNESNTEVISFQINQHILTIQPETVWDEYIRSHSPMDEARTPERLAELPRPALKKTSDWPPSKWKILESLGEGGQGWTFKVHRSSDPDRTPYVLKRLKNKERLPRFKSEISALTKLRHPGILKIVETSDKSETPFFVAEYCDGLDLGRADLSGKDLLAKLHIFRQVCDAVAAAHGAKILHRDLKPPNIFLRKDGSVVVGDFGLCIDLGDSKKRATQTLEGVGAERYIAPEVAKGRVQEPQASSDIYSLGKVLYYILSGRTLLREEYAEGQDDLRRQEAGPYMHLVYEVFNKTINERPEGRFQSAADLLYALDTIIERVQLKAHVLDPEVRQACMFCVIGEYQPMSPVNQGELTYVCSNCGNIQRFTRPRYGLWWERK